MGAVSIGFRSLTRWRRSTNDTKRKGVDRMLTRELVEFAPERRVPCDMKNIARKSSPPPAVKTTVTPLEASVTELKNYVEEHRRTRSFAPGEFAAFERKTMELATQIGRATVETELRESDVEAEAIEIAGKTTRRVLRRRRRA